MGGQKYFALKQLAIKFLRPYPYEVTRHILAHGRAPRLTHPITFNDKVAHRKFYDFNPIYLTVADKLHVRTFVAQKLGSDILSTLYYCGESIEDIEFSKFPDSFVMKATHGSGPGFIRFINKKATLPENQLKVAARELISQDYGNVTNEWWYTKITPQLIIEEMLIDDTFGIPVDYKFFVFHGQTHYIQVDYSRFENHTRTFYNRKWLPQELGFKYPIGPPTSRPALLDEMIDIAEYLGKDFDFIRVDLYCVNDNRVLFGELTLAPEAGWGRFFPSKWDAILGQLW